MSASLVLSSAPASEASTSIDVHVPVGGQDFARSFQNGDSLLLPRPGLVRDVHFAGGELAGVLRDAHERERALRGLWPSIHARPAHLKLSGAVPSGMGLQVSERSVAIRREASEKTIEGARCK